MAVGTADTVLARIEEPLLTIVRHANLPRTRQRLLARAGLHFDPSAAPVLRRLDTAGPVRLTALARDLGVEPSTVSRQVKSLEQAGLVRRVADPADGRASGLLLTADGRRALRKIREAWRTKVAAIVEDFTPAERDRLADLLARVAERFVALDDG